MATQKITNIQMYVNGEPVGESFAAYEPNLISPRRVNIERIWWRLIQQINGDAYYAKTKGKQPRTVFVRKRVA